MYVFEIAAWGAKGAVVGCLFLGNALPHPAHTHVHMHTQQGNHMAAYAVSKASNSVRREAFYSF